MPGPDFNKAGPSLLGQAISMSNADHSAPLSQVDHPPPQTPDPLPSTSSRPGSLTSQSSKHVSISMDALVPSAPIIGTAQEDISKGADQLQSSVDVGNPTVSKSAIGQTSQPHTSSLSLNANQHPQGRHDVVTSNVNNTSVPIPLSTEPAHPDLTQYNEFWNSYNELADREDKEIVKGYGSDLDTLLIFAGLFSATNTAFIVESYKDLKEDQAETTNKLLRSLILTIHRSSSFTESDLHEARFSATRQSTSTNLFFFTSLFCSLLAAFGAVIGKQWLNHYEKEGQLRSPAERGVERHKKYMGLEQWHFQGVIETLPTLLQVSLLSFLMGLVQFLWTFNLPVAIVALIFTVVTSGFWFIFIIIGVSHPSSPFQTRLSVILQTRRPFMFLNRDSKDGDAVEDEITRGRCVDWLMKRSTAPATLTVVAKAVAMLSNAARSAIDLDRVGAAIGYLLQSKFEINRVHLGVTTDIFQSSLVALRDITRNWNTSDDYVHPEDYRNRLFTQTLRHELWNLLFNKENQDPVLKEAGMQILERICTGAELDPRGRMPVMVEVWEDRCFAWFPLCKPESEKVWIVAKSILQGAPRNQAVTRLGRPLGLLLDSTIRDNVVSLQVSDESLRVLVPVLKDLISCWDKTHDLVHEGDPSNNMFLRALNTKLWYIVLNPSWQNDQLNETIFHILETEILVSIQDEEGLKPMIKSMNEHLLLDSIGDMYKLRCLRILYCKLASLKLVPKNYIQCHDAVRRLLMSTMWGPDEVPECQYADVRMGWILDNIDEAYPWIVESNYSQYLSKWRMSLLTTQVSDLTVLYFKSLRRLLIVDPKIWTKRLELDNHIVYLKHILQYPNSFPFYRHCLAYFFLYFKEVGPDSGVIHPQLHNDRSDEWVQIIKSYLSLTSDGSGLYPLLIDVVDSPTEEVRIAIGFWRFLVAAHRLRHVTAQRISLERHIIADHFLNRQGMMHGSFDAEQLEMDIIRRPRNAPAQHLASIYPSIDDVDRSSFILLIPNTDPDIQLLATEMFSPSITRLRLAYSTDDWVNILGSMGNILDMQSDVWMEILERENYVEIIAKYIGDATRTEGAAERPRDMRWWCLRLFLLMWHRRSAMNPIPYVSKYCFQRLNSFFGSMETRVEVDIVESQRGIDNVPLTALSALEFMESACTYFESVSAGSGIPIPIAVASGYRETCGHFVVSGANRSAEYLGDDGKEKWKSDIVPLVERIETLLR